MNCIYQKAISDNVYNNKCVLNNVLWFHLECPKWADYWDHPEYFKTKMLSYLKREVVSKLTEGEDTHH